MAHLGRLPVQRRGQGRGQRRGRGGVRGASHRRATAATVPIPSRRGVLNVRGRGRTRGSSLAVWECPFCLSEFSTKRELAQHKRLHSEEERSTVRTSDRPKCQICNRVFNNYRDLAHHGNTSGHSFSRFRCPYCYRKFSNRIDLRDHQSEHYEQSGYTVVASAFSNAIEVVEKVFSNSETAPSNIDSLFEMEGDNLYNIIKAYIVRLRFISLYIVFTAKFTKRDGNGTILETLMIPLRTHVYTLVLFHMYQIRTVFSRMAEKIKARIDTLEQEGSNLVLEYFSAISINIVQKNFQGGGTPHIISNCLVDADIDLYSSQPNFIEEVPRIRKSKLLRRQSKYLVDCKSHIRDGCFVSNGHFFGRTAEKILWGHCDTKRSDI